jgi:thiol-disulfide isomerase/thioredoxin
MKTPTIAAVCVAVIAAFASAQYPPVPPAAIAQSKQDAAPAKPKADYGKYEFTLKTLEGKTVKLSDYAGKVVLVNLWAPWCGPCKIEMPGFEKLHEKYRSQGFEIISVAVQTTESAVRGFIEKTPLPWTVGMNDEVAVKYGTYGLPDNYVFLPDGMLVKRFIGYTKEEALEPVIQAALKKVRK